MEDILLVGYGGHAKSVADSIERQGKYHIIGYTDIEEHMSSYQYLGTDDVLKDYYENGVIYAAVGIGFIGKSAVRNRIYSQLKEIGYTLPIIADPSSIIAKTVKLGEGTFIGKKAIINVEASIGKMAIINTNAVVEHECKIGDFSHVAVGAALCGQVQVGKQVMIGAGATVIQGIHILDNSVIGAGAAVVKDVKENTLVVGCPATEIKK